MRDLRDSGDTVVIEVIVEPVVVLVPLRTIAVEIPHVAVVTRVETYNTSSISPSFECSQD